MTKVLVVHMSKSDRLYKSCRRTVCYSVTVLQCVTVCLPLSQNSFLKVPGKHFFSILGWGKLIKPKFLMMSNKRPHYRFILAKLLQCDIVILRFLWRISIIQQTRSQIALEKPTWDKLYLLFCPSTIGVLSRMINALVLLQKKDGKPQFTWQTVMRYTEWWNLPFMWMTGSC